MAGERTYPILPCADLDESIAFYESLGFKRTFRQLRPNPYAVVALEDMQIHLFGMDDFDPSNSYGSVIVTVPDPDGLYQAFAAGLRQHYGKLPVQGIPRLLRPRKKYGTVRGFTLVDPGGNWLRVSKLAETESEASSEETSGLAQILEVAARLGDAHGDEAKALNTLETGLARYKDAAALDLARAHLYKAELAVRMGNIDLGARSLAVAEAVGLADDEQALLAEDFAHIKELVGK